MFKWLAKKIRNAEQDGMREPALKASNVVSLDSEEGDDPIRFELTSAVGGRILRVRRYDRRKHESDVQTYVIPQGEDVGERVTKILNLELLK